MSDEEKVFTEDIVQAADKTFLTLEVGEPAFNRTVTFHNEKNEQVGCFDFGADPMTFVGNADESAKIFIEAVLEKAKENGCPKFN